MKAQAAIGRIGQLSELYGEELDEGHGSLRVLVVVDGGDRSRPRLEAERASLTF
jgi:hypothetical protein